MPSKMTDYRTRDFRAQVAMDSVLRTAMIEIAKIFENTLHDHQMELAQKGEEILQLKMKLQKTELKLKESQNDCHTRVEKDQIQVVETQREPENASRQTSHDPEVDFEVPDDWCAPLGYENLTKQNDGVCPSVRLRRLSIPLWHVPIIKKEVVNHDIESHQPTKAGRKSKRGSSLKESDKPTQDKITPTTTARRSLVRNDMKRLLREIKQEYSGSAVPTGQRRRGRNLTGKEQENVTKSKNEGRKNTATESVSKQKETVQNDGKMYTCKFCCKVFDTEFGLNVHIRSHKKCRACKKEFPFPSALINHKISCRKLKKSFAKESQSCDQEKLSTPGKKQETVRRESTPSSDSCSASSRRHKDQITSKETNGDLGWTKPLEEPEENGESLIASSKDTSGAANFNNVQKEHSSDKRKKWQTMGTRRPNGYSCLTCLKLVKSKGLLIEHYRIHTGEKPIKCEKCPKKFNSSAQLYKHRKRCRISLKKIPCRECGKIFPTPRELNRHVFDFHRDWPNICQDCGKGFLTEGRLKNHIQRFHK